MDIKVIKIGGSILYDDNLIFNNKFLKKVINWYKENQGCTVVFVVGGGKLSRFLLNQVGDEIKKDSCKHQVGIRVTKVNSVILEGLFNDKSVEFFDSLGDLCSSIRNKRVRGAIIGGLVEGWSTDMVAANIANELNVRLVTKISDIDYIYTADPSIQKDAKPLPSVTWDQYIQIFNNHIGKKHEPGMSAPIDIESSMFCKKNNISFRVSGGHLNLEVKDLLEKGTLVS